MNSCQRMAFPTTLLTNAMKMDFDAAELEMNHRRDPLDAFDHARGNCRKKQFCGVEGTAVDVRVENRLRILATGHAGVGIQPLRNNIVFEHQAFLFDIE